MRLMRRAVLGTLLLASGLVLSGADGPSPDAREDRIVLGTGTIRFGHENNGVAMFDMQIDGTQGARPLGRALCAAEAHDALYPDIIIRIEEFHSMHLEGRKVKIIAHGTLHDDEVTVHITAYDGEGTTRADRFGIRTMPHEHGDDDHGLEFEAEGELWSGDIQIGTAS